MSDLAALKFLLNFIGLLSSGFGAFILAYDIFSLNPGFEGFGFVSSIYRLVLPNSTRKFEPGTWAEEIEKIEHEKRNENRIKAAMILIPLGAVSQLLALFIDQ